MSSSDDTPSPLHTPPVRSTGGAHISKDVPKRHQPPFALWSCRMIGTCRHLSGLRRVMQAWAGPSSTPPLKR